MKITFHTKILSRPLHNRISVQCVEADNPVDALRKLLEGDCEEKLRDTEFPIAWSPEPSATRGGERTNDVLYEQAMENGRTVTASDGVWSMMWHGRIVAKVDGAGRSVEVISPRCMGSSTEPIAAKDPAVVTGEPVDARVEAAPMHCGRCGVIYTGGTEHRCTTEADRSMAVRDEVGIVRSLVLRALDAAGAGRVPFDPFHGFFGKGTVAEYRVDDSARRDRPLHTGSPFGRSPDTQPTSPQVAPVFGSAKIALGE